MRFVFYSLLILTFYSCSIKEQTKLFEPYEGPIAEVYNVQSLFSDSAIVRVVMKAPIQYELQNSDREFPEGVSIDFFDDDGEIETTLVSNYAKYDAEKRLYNVKGDVIINNIEYIIGLQGSCIMNLYFLLSSNDHLVIGILFLFHFLLIYHS